MFGTADAEEWKQWLLNGSMELAECARPPAPLEASSRPRPLGFNNTMRMDLKYLKDAVQLRHVMVSMVDAGTSYRTAVVLKNRSRIMYQRRFSKPGSCITEYQRYSWWTKVVSLRQNS